MAYSLVISRFIASRSAALLLGKKNFREISPRQALEFQIFCALSNLSKHIPELDRKLQCFLA